MYKIFKVTYNDGGWYSSGGPPHFFYIAKSEEDIIANSEIYKQYLEWQERSNGYGDIWIHEVSNITDYLRFENLEDFDVAMSIKRNY